MRLIFKFLLLASSGMEHCKFYPNCTRNNCRKLHIDLKEYPCAYIEKCKFRNSCLFSHDRSLMYNNRAMDFEKRLSLLKGGYQVVVAFEINSNVIALSRINPLDPQQLYFTSQYLATMLFYFKYYNRELALVFDAYLPSFSKILTNHKKAKPFKFLQKTGDTCCFETVILPLLGILTTDSFICYMHAETADQVYNLLSDLFEFLKIDYLIAMTEIVTTGLVYFHSIDRLKSYYYPIVLSELFYPIFKALSMICKYCPSDEWNAVFENFLVLFHKAQNRDMFLVEEQRIINQIYDIVNHHKSTATITAASSSTSVSTRLTTPENSIKIRYIEDIPEPINNFTVELPRSPTSSTKSIRKRSEKMRKSVNRGVQQMMQIENTTRTTEVFSRMKRMIEKMGKDVRLEFDEMVANEDEHISNVDNDKFKQYKYFELSAEKYLFDVEKAKTLFLEDYKKYIEK